MVDGIHAGSHTLGLSKTHTSALFQALERLHDLSVVSREEFFLHQANTIRLFHGHFLLPHETLCSRIQTRLYRVIAERLWCMHHQASKFLL